MMRGGKEIAKFLQSAIHFDEYKRSGFRQAVPDENKITRRTLDTPVIDSSTMRKKLRETPVDPNNLLHDTCDPYHVLRYFKSL